MEHPTGPNDPKLSTLAGGTLPHYFGAENDPFTALLGRKWAISVVSRALKPGNKVDTTLLLVGKQGIGKSRAIRTLAVRPEWFNDTSLDIGSRDGRLALLGTWLMELGELDSLKRSQLSAIKAFLTDQEDRYRMPYGRMEITVPRSCVFVGTTNERVMLRDSTGNRRFWPVEVTSIDIDGLKRDRDQLWAEAVVRHDDGEPWWLDGAESKELARRAEAFTQGDSWTELLEVWLDGRETFTTAEALEGAVGIAPARQSRPDTLRMTGLLTDLGFRSCRRKRPDGTRPRVWTLEPS